MCKVEGCDRQGPFIRGMCKFHYQRWRRSGGKTVEASPPVRRPRCCKGCGCRLSTYKTSTPGVRPHAGRGYCQNCKNYIDYHQIGQPTELPPGVKKYIEDRRERGVPVEGYKVS